MNQSSEDKKTKEDDVTGRERLTHYIISSLVARFGEANRKSIARYVTKYKNLILRDMLDVLTYTERHQYYQDDESVKIFLVNSYARKWGQLTLNGTRTWANTILAPVLCNILVEGRTGVATAVRLKDITMDALMEFAIEENTDTVWRVQHGFDFDTQEVFATAVNSASLREAIKQWEREVRQLAGSHKAKMLRNISMGKAILNSLTDDGKFLQEMTQADSGRIYFKGLNLQGCPKAVRHAALGKCHLYDMRVGAFAVMAALAKTYAEKELQQQVHFHTIKGYIKNKDEVRMRITQYVYPVQTKDFKDITDYKGFFGFYNVKGALTAIGFGAKRNASSVWKNQDDKWQKTSLLNAFKGNKDETQRFIDCPLATDLLDEYAECSKIVELRLENESEFSSFFKITPDMSRGQRLAMVYQGMECQVLAAFIKQLATADELLLPVHDGLYVKHKVDLPSVHFNLDVPFISDKSFIQFDHTACNTSQAIDPAAIEAAAHRQRIAEQAAKAMRWVRGADSIVSASLPERPPVVLFDADYENNRRAQFERDVREHADVLGYGDACTYAGHR